MFSQRHYAAAFFDYLNIFAFNDHRPPPDRLQTPRFFLSFVAPMAPNTPQSFYQLQIP